MCGIFAVIGSTQYNINVLRGMMARGPDSFNCVQKRDARLYHTRLAIVGLTSKTTQPFESGEWTATVNGEIYNHKELGSLDGASDCSVIVSQLEKHTPAEACLSLIHI